MLVWSLHGAGMCLVEDMNNLHDCDVLKRVVNIVMYINVMLQCQLRSRNAKYVYYNCTRVDREPEYK